VERFQRFCGRSLVVLFLLVRLLRFSLVVDKILLAVLDVVLRFSSRHRLIQLESELE
jgi:hypothetical protein